jgi:Na+-transporting NADH:ubiquinone oxidoreductase subunit F
MLQTYKTFLTKKTQLNSNTYLYHFDLIDPKEIIFNPGQYVILKVPTDKGPVSRLYSISSSTSDKNSFQLIIEIIPGGLASNYLSSLEEGKEVVFQGPGGLFNLKENNNNKIFMITGTGIAPILSIIKSEFKIKNLKFKIKLFWGIKNYTDIYLIDELKNLEFQISNFKFQICLSREENLDMIPEEDKKYFELGHIDACFEKLAPKPYSLITSSEFYLCGSRSVVESLKLFLLSKNIPKENIIFEKF